MKPRIQFILKRREDYSQSMEANPIGLSTGLYNSAKFVTDMLAAHGQDVDLQVAIDNNCIDRIVTAYQPTHVVIEALWVVPTKFSELVKIHPDIKWIVRLHSEMPFMAGEGMALDWIAEYLKFPQVSIGVNAPRMCDEVRTYAATALNLSEKDVIDRVVYMPNFYPQNYASKSAEKSNKYRGEKYWVDIGCFGAVRPLKNHMVQAIAAVKYANHAGKQLRFHVNANRVEMKGDAMMNNLRGMFEQMADHGYQLIGHEWTVREEFLKLCATMDIGLQSNFSETFNIVCADLVSQGIPIVGSREIPWASSLFNGRPTESDEIYYAICRSLLLPKVNVWLNQHNLTKYTNETTKIWLAYIKRQS